MDSYNSRYPVEYYEIGTPYMFYTDSTIIGNRNKLASVDLIQKYKGKFSALQKDKKFSVGFNKNTSPVSINLSRYVGFVVNITDNIIHVLYQCRINGVTEFRVTQYITSNSQKVFTDDLEKFVPSLFVDKTNLIGSLSSKYTDTRTTVNSVTKADDEFTEPFASRVSGVTKANKSDTVSGLTVDDDTDEFTRSSASRTSGLTVDDDTDKFTKSSASGTSGLTVDDDTDEFTRSSASGTSGLTVDDDTDEFTRSSASRTSGLTVDDDTD